MTQFCENIQDLIRRIVNEGYQYAGWNGEFDHYVDVFSDFKWDIFKEELMEAEPHIIESDQDMYDFITETLF